jgi:hypothetical protein
MIFFYEPGKVIFGALFWCGVWGIFVWMSIFHTPHADYLTKCVLLILGIGMFCVAAFFVVTAAIWVWRGFAAFFTTAWRRE